MFTTISDTWLVSENGSSKYTLLSHSYLSTSFFFLQTKENEQEVNSDNRKSKSFYQNNLN